ncbi:hypothetical protein GALAXY_11 [Arthrobacter phage Galaxy]|uniref:Uncharacterized protein n=2 Tax=Galaxyvirus TaxID=2560134 RepID=A0A222ZG63_9CAUD|nr:neck protein [Arthrobacter phage Galaxy]YP_009610231.1 neck protein [Arthrobacter phage Abidatro]ALY08857.1 hypothetical protein GALAXY_11 [Arthrobacter phage Galaxy]ASR83181.1 hypothetical protein SEA_ABIDATRO_11 [Arthrobacter phage Abidatro]
MGKTSKITKIEFLSPGFRAALNSPEVKADLLRRGYRIAVAAGDGFNVKFSPSDRARVMVAANTRGARKAEAKDKALTRAIGAGRG